MSYIDEQNQDYQGDYVAIIILLSMLLHLCLAVSICIVFPLYKADEVPCRLRDRMSSASLLAWLFPSEAHS